MSETRRLLDAWLPPENAGAPIACLASSFTFEPEFFEGECLARFLSLDTARNEGMELQFLIEQEERLGETGAAVIVDRSYQAEGRSLRWDILAVGLRGGVQHAKVSLLVWENVLRIIVGSANLVASAYRWNVETGIVLDAGHGTELSEELFAGLIAALRDLVVAAEGRPEEEGPKQRALETLEMASSRVESRGLRTSRGRSVRMRVVPVEPGKQALTNIRDVWQGPLPHRATVMSPFFDADGALATAGLMDELRRRGSVSSTFVVPIDYTDGRTLIRAPRSILDRRNDRISIEFREFSQPNPQEPRRLHAKAVFFESDEWVAALVGSSNFTAAGLGLLPRGGNLEVNLAFGAPSASAEAAQLRQLIPAGDPLDPNEGEWEPEQDDEEQSGPVLPFGFAECLLDPPPSPEIILRFRPAELPDTWSVRLPQPSGRLLLDGQAWAKTGRRTEVRCPLAEAEHPFLLRVGWDDSSCDWPLNVTDPSRLPPPEKLRDLPADVLILALASTRPLHEALAGVLERSDDGDAVPIDLNALNRYSSVGHLFQRTRRLSAALEGLQRRLERPAATIDVLTWRLRGPFGPRVLADGLVRKDQPDGIEGEAAFFIAELALTLSRVDWEKAARYLSLDQVQALARVELRWLRKRARGVPSSDARLRAYVERALREARV